VPEPAASTPVARVVVDTPLAHLDRPFDYLVPESMDEAAGPGVRVRVRFAGKAVEGWLLERVEATEHGGKLAFLSAVVSPEQVLAPEIARLTRALADHMAGVLPDVLRLAVPPRHARVEKEPPGEALPAAPAPEPATWARYPGGPGYLAALARGDAPRAVWTALPGPDWPRELAAAVQATLAGGRGAVVVVPDARDLARMDAALLQALGGPGRHVTLAAELGPPERYRRWLKIRRGEVRAVVGTRGAAFAPVADVGLLACWDDGDDVLTEPLAPYPHVRDILVLRSHLAGCAVLLGGHAPSVEAVALTVSGWARPLAAERTEVRRAAPRVELAGGPESVDGPARIPGRAFSLVRQVLAAELPVLVQVPRRGYDASLACENCRAAARCVACSGPLARSGRSAIPACQWCGRPEPAWVCPHCSGTVLRAPVAGGGRTAEELGRAFPGVVVRASQGETILADIPAGPSLVVATPGAEPVAPGEGYGAAVLLDGALLLGRIDLRAAEVALRRWIGAAALVRTGGAVVAVAPAGVAAVQALVRWDPFGYAAREADERAELGFPPAVRMASVEGPALAVLEFVESLALPPGAARLGPVELGLDPEGTALQRMLLRVPRGQGEALAAALKQGRALRSSRRVPGRIRIQLDPSEIG
jgi:primosomal protein N' (replication factor Y)